MEIAATQDYTQSNFPYEGLNLTEKFKSRLFPHQSETVEWMLYREQVPYENVRGGLVFHDMGTGKSICGLSCAVLGGGLTLVIVPAQLVYVWEAEIKRHFEDVSYFVYHGPQRKKRFERYRLKDGDPDIVLMSYQSVTKDINDEGGPLRNMEFFRVIFDECHYIKNPSTETFVTATRIASPVKWFLSGTPIMNNMHEMYPYLKLLKYGNLRNIQQIRAPLRIAMNYAYRQREHITRRQYVEMQNLLKVIAIRRTKDILSLPTKTYVDVIVKMKDTEESFYTTLKEYSRKRVKCLMRNIKRVNASGLAPAEQNRMRIIILQCMLSLLFHLRLACCDPLLVIDKIPRIRDRDVASATRELRKVLEQGMHEDVNSPNSQNSLTCPVCYNDEALVRNSECGHVACRDCWTKLSKMEPMRCFTCMEPTDVIHLEDNTVAKTKSLKKSHDERVLHRSSKTREILRFIKKELEEGKKVCVVSQWTTYLDRLISQFKCENRGVDHVKLDGSVAPIKRQQTVNAFQDNDDIKVCFASLGSSAEGITLHAACTMIVCDVYWNKAKISQISDRIHRIGQKRDVTVYCIYMQDSIEMKLKELVEQKDLICRVIVDCKQITVSSETLLSKVIKLLS